MKVVLAEKPSVGRDIAACLGCRARHDGYLEGGGYQVTWAFGHLFTLKEPGEYDPAFKKWSLETLPIVPDRFELKTTQGKGIAKQFATIKRLFKAADEIICATDAGREGELIFRRALQMSGCARKPVRRLWLSSLTDDAIRAAFRSLRPLSDYDDLHNAARCRSEADWIVGLNATRSFTVRHGRESGVLWSVGRVQTPVLAMIVERDDTIRSFEPEPFWEVMTRYRDVLFRYAKGRLPEEGQAEEILQRVVGHPLAITGVDARERRQPPPLLHDLTELQREMNRRHGLSASATLKAAQSLYEAKLITYPRTDSRYLSKDMKPAVRKALDQLRDLKRDEIGRLDTTSLTYTRRIVNDAKVTDHHAIIPTGKAPDALESAAQKVFDAVLTRLIAVFYPACVKEITTVDGVSNGVPFQAKGTRVLDPGWTALYPAPSNTENQDDRELPRFTPGESGPHEPFVREGETKPPPAFTENSLLGAMETAGKFVDEGELKEALKEKGLGTPATRADIIETLLKRGYVARGGKALSATDLGRYLIALIHEPSLKSPELTGEWEGRLREMEGGRSDPERFRQEVVEYTRRIVGAEADAPVDEGRLGDCPRCGKHVIEGTRGYGCSAWQDGCGFVLWRDYEGLTLTEAQARELLQRRLLMDPVTMPDGRTVVLYLSQTGAVMDIAPPDASGQGGRGKRPARSRARGKGGSQPCGTRTTKAGDDATVGECPLCGAVVVERPKSFSCSQASCDLVVWKTVAKKRISVTMARALLTKGQTSVLKGFKSKRGSSFDARLVLKGGKVEMEFDS
ncbi:DNA topoisomerase 3 [Candidatus Poribacteria bacterium]|nr:DNA topoisomerase 3 [Candidatus Poribacteria bacterium]MBT5532567.1 DNA topoisomerase 3 [Candidatus Poribacteria bacterium]MBT7101824.1 DNA topoisomerase 3 [Candidatus Poribacteria bacterium]MBT7806196.1 DNA topoisomerase 3 [Candidatus Poribacteria bacterium]